MNGREEIAQRAPQAVQLIDEIEDDRNALVVHAAQVSGAEVLYSEDLSDGQAYGFSARRQSAAPRL